MAISKRRLAVAGLLVAAVVSASLSGDGVSQEPEQRLGHPRVHNPASLGGERAEAVYQAIRESVRRGYAQSDDPEALAYQSWKRFNRFPYRSRHHGERFVNHYANEKGAGYGDFENARPMPEGAIIVKDSFTVTGEGVLMAGPLTVMEKMRAGFPSSAGTWRFWALRPDGSMVGMTAGPNADKVEFCAACHRDAGAKNDFLYFLPAEARLAE